MGAGYVRYIRHRWAAVTARSVLRSQVQELSGGMCEWPGPCPNPGQELAHLHSVGMGGRKAADVISNVAWMCHRHARMTDGLQENWPDFKQGHNALLGDGWEERIPMVRWAWERAEALTRHVAARRKALGFDERAV